MIGTGLMRAPRGRWSIWPVAIAGLVVSQVILTAPALAGAARSPDATIGARTLVNCGGGIQAVNVTLPAGFNPLTATQSELINNGLPARPSGRVQLATWKRLVTGQVRAARSSCALTKAAPAAAAMSIVGDVTIIGNVSIVGDASMISADSIVGDSTNIGSDSIVGDSIVGDASIVGDTTPASIVGDSTKAGASPLASSVAAAASTAKNHFLDTYGTWRVRRAFRHTAGGSTGLATAGLALGTGSSAAAPKVEAGSAARGPAASGRYHYYLWWRVYPQQAMRQGVSLDVAPGDTVYAHIRLGNGRALITVRDESTGAGGSYLVHLTKLAR
jgi:Peptidase A4 family